MMEQFHELDPETKRKIIEDGLNKVYDFLYRKYDWENPQFMDDAEKNHQIDILHSLILSYGAENVWDEFITHGVPEFVVKDMESKEYETYKCQESQTRRIMLEDFGADLGNPAATFGMHEPGYSRALKDDLEELESRKELHTLLLGAMTYHSIDEFGTFSRGINESAVPLAIDKEGFSLKLADPSLASTVRADATNLPLPNQSMDMVFSNYLIPWLRSNGALPSGKIIVGVLKEAARVLKNDGYLVMCEKTPSIESGNLKSWMSLLLLEATLRDLDLTFFQDYYAASYESRMAKHQEDSNRIHEFNRIDPEDGNPKPFSYIIKARKLKTPIAADYKEPVMAVS